MKEILQFDHCIINENNKRVLYGSIFVKGGRMKPDSEIIFSDGKYKTAFRLSDVTFMIFPRAGEESYNLYVLGSIATIDKDNKDFDYLNRVYTTLKELTFLE